MPALRAATAAALISIFGLSGEVAAQANATVRGRVTVTLEGTSLSNLGPVVITLEAVDRRAPAAARDGGRVRQRAARFSPGFLVVAAGQTVAMSNDDAIYHNVFSFSPGNEFDLGLYPSGESREVKFDDPGLVKIYCSIHESMNGAILVSPGPHFARTDERGAFSIESVPPGRYRLRTWCERLPDTEREIVLAPGQTLVLEVDLAAAVGG